MKPILVKKQSARPEDCIGRVLCHDLVYGGPAARAGIRKGHWIGEEEVSILLNEEWDELHLIEPGPEDLSEAESGMRLARALAGNGIEVKARPHGKCELVACHKGLLKVDVESLRQVNMLEGLAVYTLFTNQVVCREETVAHAQITPLVVPQTSIEEAERISDGGGVIQVLPFSPLQVGALLTGKGDERGRDRFCSTLKEKLRWFGSDNQLDFLQLPNDPERIAKTIRAFLGWGTDLLLVAGGNALDPLDPVSSALLAVGARMEHHGMPAHPGTLLWIASLNHMIIIGLPACGMYSHKTLFDLILPRLLAEGKMEAGDFAEFGHGGILDKRMDFRFPPYAQIEEMEEEDP